MDYLTIETKIKDEFQKGDWTLTNDELDSFTFQSNNQKTRYKEYKYLKNFNTFDSLCLSIKDTNYISGRISEHLFFYFSIGNLIFRAGVELESYSNKMVLRDSFGGYNSYMTDAIFSVFGQYYSELNISIEEIVFEFNKRIMKAKECIVKLPQYRLLYLTGLIDDYVKEIIL